VCSCDEQFEAQSAQLRNGKGFMHAHLHGTQFGAQPVSTADGKQVLTAHSMFTVVTHAFDKVKLRGAFPRALVRQICGSHNSAMGDML
jgi:hypothetical protein